MNKIRIRFRRGDSVKFISHLDLMKTFERALRRSGLPIMYSQGFNPHPQMVFGLPLAVGVTSEGEYADFIMDTGMEMDEFLSKLNAQLPEDLSVLEANHKFSSSNIMAEISASDYEITLASQTVQKEEALHALVDAFLSNPSILIMKPSKKGEKEVDIRPMIDRLQASFCDKGEEKRILLEAALSAGSQQNLKPELLIAALNHYQGMDFMLEKVHRKQLYVDVKGQRRTPFDPASLGK